MSLPDIVSREEWLAARKQLLAKEKAMTRAARRAQHQAPRAADGARSTRSTCSRVPTARPTLLDLFDGRRQLIVRHFMFDPSWDDGCPSCTAGADEMSDGLLAPPAHARHDVRRDRPARRSRRSSGTRRRKGWTFPWYSSFGSDFNYDFHVTLDESVAPVEYNYRTPSRARGRGHPVYVDGEQPIEQPGQSCFLRDGDDGVPHVLVRSPAAPERLGGSYYFLDLTALGRQEDWEEPKGRAERPRGAVPDFAT